jgi:DNA-binding Xre family transcriptional regulator
MEAQGIDSYAEVSRRTGIFVTVVTRLAKNDTRGIEFDTLLRLCVGLGVTPNALFEIDVRSEEDVQKRDIDDKQRVVERLLDDVLGINDEKPSTPTA